MATKNTAKEPNFEKSLQKLERIVEEMEQGEIDLDGMLKKFEEGMKLARFCTGKLEETEKKIEIILKDKAGTISTRDFVASEQEEQNKQEPESSNPVEKEEEEQDLF